MKRLTKKNICMSSWCQVVAVCILASQIIHLGTHAQSTNEEKTIPAAEQNVRITRALNSTGDCPLCNLSEVSVASESENFLNNLIFIRICGFSLRCEFFEGELINCKFKINPKSSLIAS